MKCTTRKLTGVTLVLVTSVLLQTTKFTSRTPKHFREFNSSAIRKEPGNLGDGLSNVADVPSFLPTTLFLPQMTMVEFEKAVFGRGRGLLWQCSRSKDGKHSCPPLRNSLAPNATGEEGSATCDDEWGTVGSHPSRSAAAREHECMDKCTGHSSEIRPLCPPSIFIGTYEKETRRWECLLHCEVPFAFTRYK